MSVNQEENPAVDTNKARKDVDVDSVRNEFKV